MDRYQRGYDQGYDQSYGRGQRFRGAPYGPPFRSSGSQYGRDYYSRPLTPYGGYTREPWGGDYGFSSRYDQEFRYGPPRKSQWQTEQGDPFGDRQRHTPMRMIRGEPDWRDRDRAMRGYGRDYNRGYGRDYNRGYEAWGFPQQYQPYSPESGYHID